MSYDKDTGIYEGYIYCITNAVTGKQYVGQTLRTVYKRWRCHVSESRTTGVEYPFHRAIQKYGEDSFSVETLVSIQAESKNILKKKLNDSEKHYIKTLNTIRPNGYNLTKGGDTSSYCRARSIIQVNQLGEVLNYFESTAEACRQIGVGDTSLSPVLGGFTQKAYGYYWFYSNSKQIEDGKIVGWDYPEKYIAQYSSDGNLLNVYSSLQEASENTGITTSRIGDCCRGARPIAYGYLFKYCDTPSDAPVTIDAYYTYKNLDKVVAQYSLGGNLLNVFKDRIRAAKETGISCSVIDNCCNGLKNTVRGFQFRYYDDVNSVCPSILKYVKYPDSEKYVAQYSPKGDLVQLFESSEEAFLKTGILKTIIKACCRLEDKSANGFQFRYYSDLGEVEYAISPYKIRKRKVIQKAKDGKIVGFFDSLSDAEKATNVNHSRIAACCRKRINAAGGFIWEYAEEIVV